MAMKKDRSTRESYLKKREIDYRQYSLSLEEWLFAIMSGIVCGGILVMIFYRSIIMIFLGGCIGAFLSPFILKKRKLQKRQLQLRMEFKEALYHLIAALQAGRSLELSFTAALEDMDAGILPYMFREWQTVVDNLAIGLSVEESLENFGNRSGIEEICSFARTVEICKRTEGDVARVMENTIHLLQDRMDIQMELKVLLAKKKTEQKILSIMPFCVIGLLLLMSPDYLIPLYHSFQGQCIMTVCVGLSVFSYWLSKKMANITL